LSNCEFRSNATPSCADLGLAPERCQFEIDYQRCGGEFSFTCTRRDSQGERPCEDDFNDEAYFWQIQKPFEGWAMENWHMKLHDHFWYLYSYPEPECYSCPKCEWFACEPEEVREGFGEEYCWRQECDFNCDNYDCKIWHAVDYNYDRAHWMWESDPCPEELGPLEQAMMVAD